MLPTGTNLEELAKVFNEKQTEDMKRFNLESEARTTPEHAISITALLGERCKQPWLLVTSAWQILGSMSEFEATSCNFKSYPVDFYTAGESSWTDYSMAGSLMAWQKALHEYLLILFMGLPGED